MRKHRNHLQVIDRVAKIPCKDHIGFLLVKACKAIQSGRNANTEERQSCGSKVLNQRDEFAMVVLPEKWLFKQLS